MQFAESTHDPLDQVVALLELRRNWTRWASTTGQPGAMAEAADALARVPDAAWLQESVANSAIGSVCALDLAIICRSPSAIES